MIACRAGTLLLRLGAASLLLLFCLACSPALAVSSDLAASSVAASPVLAALDDYLARPWPARPPLDDLAFSTIPLTRDEAIAARARLWADYTARLRATRVQEMGADWNREARVVLGGQVLRYRLARLGASPPGGRSLFIALHGGGNTAHATNDAQWDNQLRLAARYAPRDALWVAPRAPLDDWNMWFADGVDALLGRLIANLIVFEGVNPDRVYLVGYSAGGDGAYQLGTRFADRWAGVSASAGRPHGARPDNLRNVAFAAHAGKQDTDYNRHLETARWGQRLDELSLADPLGYPHQVILHESKGHWLDLADSAAIPFLQAHSRNPMPLKVVWLPSAKALRAYWLALDDLPAVPQVLHAAIRGNEVLLNRAEPGLRIRLDDAMLDLDAPVRVIVGGKEVFYGKIPRTIDALVKNLAERGDPRTLYAAEFVISRR